MSTATVRSAVRSGKSTVVSAGIFRLCCRVTSTPVTDELSVLIAEQAADAHSWRVLLTHEQRAYRRSFENDRRRAGRMPQ
jgi:hypothetical protein